MDTNCWEEAFGRIKIDFRYNSACCLHASGSRIEEQRRWNRDANCSKTAVPHSFPDAILDLIGLCVVALSVTKLSKPQKQKHFVAIALFSLTWASDPGFGGFFLWVNPLRRGNQQGIGEKVKVISTH